MPTDEPGRPRNPDKWLERVYSAAGADALASTYDEWAATYDTDMLRIGYANPAVAAGLVGRHVRERDGNVLDAGAGTGTLGEILAIMGYRSVFGVDLSEGMLAKAKARNAYRELRKRALGEALDFPDGYFTAIVSFGVFTPGHAPPAAFDELTRVTRPGGRLIFTVSTAAWRDCGFEKKIGELEAGGRLRLVERTGEYRPMPRSHTEATFTTQAFVYALA
jgi:SAM-dependent methyltransferase